uniref:Conotoxin n=1 Tax=Conus betulinus TaxID=89764 RepID=A0A142C1I5_CONBE|nr:conotoxin [Conus betulinus]
MEFRRLVTVALLLTLVMSIDSAPADQTETGRVSLREDDRFPCNSDQCACLPREGSSTSYQCQSTSASTADCVNNNCITESEW